jgi:alpha-mannosidase
MPVVTDETGREYPAQHVQAHSITGRRRILFSTVLPPMGYRQFRIGKGYLAPVSKVSASGNTLENEFFRITISDNGEIGIYDKEFSREVFRGGATGCKGVIIDDPSDTWSHEVVDFTKSTKGDYKYTTKGEIGSFGNARLTIIENGPLRAAIDVVTRYGDSDMSIQWMLTSGSRRIEANVTLNWHEKLKMLKFSFPVNVETPEATYETPYGHIIRKTEGEEDPGQRWIDVTGENKGYGLAVFNDAKYGYCVHGSDMHITVSRSAPFAYHGPDPISKLDPDNYYYRMDQGIQTLRLMLIPHTNCWRHINAPRIAEEFIAPPIVAYQGIHDGTMEKSASYLSIDAPNVTIPAVKLSEDGNEGIIRLVETLGKETNFSLNFPSAGYTWNGRIKPYEIKTLRLDTRYGSIKEVNLLEE